MDHPTLPRRVSTVRLAGVVLATVCTLGLGASAFADGDTRLPPTTPPAYLEECGACHVAFPPSMLPEASWARTMAGLSKHFGTDASLDTATMQRIEGYLRAEAGTGRRAREAPPEDRITRANWFVREHRAIDAATWASPAVKQASNCAACHPGAARGDYNDDRVRIPRPTDPPTRSTPR
jgi:hypothetical protein